MEAYEWKPEAATAQVALRLFPSRYGWWVYASEVGLGCYPTREEATRAAAERLERCMSAHRVLVLIGTRRGHVLLIRWYVDGYVVEKIRPGLEGADSQSAPFDSVFDALGHARRLAELLGGLDWEVHLS